MSNDFEQFQDAFFEEAAEHLAIVEEGLLQLEQRPEDLDLLNKIFRSAHSIKGASGMFGFDAVAQFTHKMETLLDLLRSGKKIVTPSVADLLLKSTDCLKTLMEGVKLNAPVDENVVQRLSTELAAVSAGEGERASASPTPVAESPASSSGSAYDIRWTPPEWLFRRGLDPLQIFKELTRIGSLSRVNVDTSRLPDLNDVNPEACYLSWTMRLETAASRKEVESVFEFVREDSELSIEAVTASTFAPEPSGANVRRDPKNATLEISDGGPKSIGEILVESGAVSKEALERALSQQKRVGEILIEQKAATPQQIEQALQTQRQMEAAAQAKKADTTSIRVDTAKIDKLINLVGELVITQSMLSDLGTRFEMGQVHVLLERIAQLERNTREIQERVMSIRMVPIGTAFSRFPRLVRDLAGKLGKKINLVLSGEETELDKTVIEAIGDPLTHLVRNAADHGLETPEERLDNNKPETGVIKLHAFHEGGSICITVEDDGRGLNRDKILAKAVKQGLVSDGAALSDDQIYPLILRPGFSTADKVSDLSGRGVGMDVVKRNIESLGGTVSIKTAYGKGTAFTLKLPLTLAIIEGMTIRVGRETYIVPMLSILESIQPRPEAVKTVVGKGELIDVRGIYLPVVRLYDVFNLKPEHVDPEKAILLILETEGERVAVMVDEILGQQQVVIKSMEQNFRKVQGIAGATILGDGTVGFILDVRGLLEIARQGTPMAA
ncbi:chemotaxis protein CheA [Candidatus Nitrospira inopinata]|jgi:two-component system chemotaxis sensor kinase CheA|uniref:Chemotaxis protein CheA n=1 Tax=Candidatus Nitrospira inopinata TaxID=1715989 RepID=A0A0S4KVK1_9BACT|nr:chemotaxis protein CheA [Candidatus Nitrospira inopinata]CUQ67256.1 fused chemotactic sensory histidine kinase in two-component regulatory system with CheB and CheY: sensory histidine kinase; signal sensing protein [Candidatus Nitrospira inopinata]